MLGQLVAAQFSLDTVIADLERSVMPADAARNQLQALADMQRMVGMANPAALAQMRAEIVATVSATHATAQQARTASAANHAMLELADAADAARNQVTGLLRDLHRFDADLRFDSEELAADYRKREAERRAYIEGELGKGTPEGTLNASGAMVGQMADAAAHGAANNPEFQQRWDELVASTARLRDAAKTNGVSTEEFDRRLREDLRRILKAKGLSDTEIDARFAVNPDPLEAAKASVDANDIGALSRSPNSAERAPAAPAAQELSTAPPPPSSMADAMAKFGALGIVMAATQNDTGPAHGLTAQVATASAPCRST